MVLQSGFACLGLLFVEVELKPSREIDDLLALMAALREPVTGCPWDIRQTFETIAPYTIEEAYEVVDAIERHDLDDLRDELGDLLLQVVFHARIAEEQGHFGFGEVVEQIMRKLIRRHPHVFGSVDAPTPDRVKQLWGEIKAVERKERSERRGSTPRSHLDSVPVVLPALSRALKLQQRASEVGFDWNDVHKVFEKVHEELDEVREALAAQQPNQLHDEIGDLLFAAVNLARHANVDPETALRAGNAKFQRRFAFIEAHLADDGVALGEASLARMEALWSRAKDRERE